MRVRGVHKYFTRGSERVDVLNDLHLDVPDGEFLALMGPSGSGKTTLLNLIAGLDRPSEGEVWVGGQLISEMSEAQLARWRTRHVGFVFQFYHLLPVLTAYENVELPLLLLPLSAAQRKRQVMTALELVGLTDRMRHRPGQLSGGQQQRVGIARAIVTDPTLIVADEPTGDLDAKVGRRDSRPAGRTARSRCNKTIMLVTHDPARPSGPTAFCTWTRGNSSRDEREATCLGLSATRSTDALPRMKILSAHLQEPPPQPAAHDPHRPGHDGAGVRGDAGLVDPALARRRDDRRRARTSRPSSPSAGRSPARCRSPTPQTLGEGAARKPGDVRPTDSMTWQFYGGTLDPEQADPREHPVRLRDGAEQAAHDDGRARRTCRPSKAEICKPKYRKHGGEPARHHRRPRAAQGACNKRVGERITLYGINYKDIDLEFEIVGTFPDGPLRQDAP